MIASFLSPGELFEKGLDGKKLFMACLDETAELGAHFACFTCFTRTKVQTLTQKALLGAQFACFTGTKVQILTQQAVVAKSSGIEVNDDSILPQAFVKVIVARKLCRSY
jgi:hypothetical protein